MPTDTRALLIRLRPEVRQAADRAVQVKRGEYSRYSLNDLANDAILRHAQAISAKAHKTKQI